MDLIQSAINQLRESGGRMTNQRRLILETLAYCTDHPTAVEIFTRARKEDPDLNLSTVYRTMRWLEQGGLVNGRLFENERRQERFDPVEDKNRGHCHFRCRICNKIIEFPAPLLEQIERDFAVQHEAQIESMSLVLYGVCRECAASAKNSS
jgi:Fe2+ or Zn2+ uptake regulation protein